MRAVQRMVGAPSCGYLPRIHSAKAFTHIGRTQATGRAKDSASLAPLP
jgi:hypothetical protein